jgi:hypothetical protein
MRSGFPQSPLRRAAVATTVVAALAGPVIAAQPATATTVRHASTYSKLSWTSNNRHRPVATTTVAPAPTTTTLTTTTAAPAPTTTAAAPTTTAAAPTTTLAAPTTTAAAPTTTLGSVASSLPIGPGLPAGSTFFGPTNYWHSTVTNAPLDPNWSAMTSHLANEVSSLYGGVAAFNAYQYNVSFYTVAANAPKYDVHWDDCQNKGYVPAGIVDQFAQVPIPDGAVPAYGTDGELAVYSPSLDKAWEFWQAKKLADGWHACWGGRMDNVSTTPNPYFQGGFGASATGLFGAGGAVSIADVKAGHIDHVVALNLYTPAMWNNFSWPAQRSDGGDSSAGAIPEGTRLRLDPTINVDALNLTPIAKMIAKAAQKYGFIVIDRAGCVAVIGESGAGYKAATGVDPWDSLLAGTHDYQVLQNFPWNKVQPVVRDYLKP